jgi:hypothetical protein
MQKFLFVFLAFVAVFVALVPSVEGAALGRQTNAERLARGMKPLPPVKRSKTEGTSEIWLVCFGSDSGSSYKIMQTGAQRRQVSAVVSPSDGGSAPSG